MFCLNIQASKIKNICSEHVFLTRKNSVNLEANIICILLMIVSSVLVEFNSF